MRFPKAFHFIWISVPGKPRNGVRGIDDLDAEKQNVIQSWAKLHPDFQINFWNDDSAAALFQSRPQWQTLFDNCNDVGCRSDILRYAILQAFGGVYVDVDCVALRPIYSLLESIQEDVAFPLNISFLKQKITLNNFFIASVANSPFWEKCLVKIKERAESGAESYLSADFYTLFRSGPHLISSMAWDADTKNMIHSIDPKFVGLCFSEQCEQDMLQKENVLFMHKHDASWARDANHGIYPVVRSLAMGYSPETPTGWVIFLFFVVFPVLGLLASIIILQTKMNFKRIAILALTLGLCIYTSQRYLFTTKQKSQTANNNADKNVDKNADNNADKRERLILIVTFILIFLLIAAFLITTLRKRRQIKRLQNTNWILQNMVSRQEKEIRKQDEELLDNMLKGVVDLDALEQQNRKLQDFLRKKTGKTPLSVIKKFIKYRKQKKMTNLTPNLNNFLEIQTANLADYTNLTEPQKNFAKKVNLAI